MKHTTTFNSTIVILCTLSSTISGLQEAYIPKAPFWQTATELSGLALATSATVWIYAQVKMFDLSLRCYDSNDNFHRAQAALKKGNRAFLKQHEQWVAQQMRPYTIMSRVAGYSALCSLATLTFSLLAHDRASFRDDVYTHLKRRP